VDQLAVLLAEVVLEVAVEAVPLVRVRELDEERMQYENTKGHD
jgi:hypothetical protein